MKKPNFEQSLSRLEEITQQLENGSLSLDESLKMFEEGIKLSRFCEQKLSDAEQKLEILKSSDMESLDEEDGEEEKKIKKKKKDEQEEDSEEAEAEDFLF